VFPPLSRNHDARSLGAPDSRRTLPALLSQQGMDNSTGRVSMMYHSRRTRFTSALSLALLLATLTTGLVRAAPPGNAHFQRTWERTDRPVLDGVTARTWMWGPEAFTVPLSEPYAEAPGGQRSVQYFDKARMEITDPGADTDSIWYVTNGLLVVELITG